MELSDQDLERYARHIMLREIGGAGQKRLLAARVFVVGAGGIGAPALLYLAACGMGAITIADDDHVALSNLQRQVIFGTGDLGRTKTESAKARLAEINPGCRVTTLTQRLTKENAAELLAGHDLVLDGCDNFETRFAVADAAAALRIPLVSAAVGEFDAQIALFAPWLGDGACYRCFVPEPPEGAPRCTEQGVVGALTGIAGAWAALEAVKWIAGFGEALLGRILLIDGLGAETRTLTLRRDPACAAPCHKAQARP